MKLITPALLLPPISLFIDLLQVDEWILEINDTYTKQTLRNRYYIATNQGIRAMIIPIKKVNGSHTITKDILLDESADWLNYHHKTLITNYRNSAYFDYYEDEIIDIFSHYKKLYELNMAFIKWILKQLDINIKVSVTENYEKQYSIDYIDDRDKYSKYENIQLPYYRQVFIDKFGFISNLSILDLLCNLGAESVIYLKNIIK
ncbi:MAG: WbqC family protein [Bacteroidales bacterium]